MTSSTTADRDDWRTFRVDRMAPKRLPGPRFTPRPVPGGDAAAFVRATVAQAWPYEATVRLHAPADAPEVDTWVTSHGRIEPLDDRSCLFHLGGDAVHSVAFLLGALEIDFDVVDAPELVAELATIANRFRRAAP